MLFDVIEEAVCSFHCEEAAIQADRGRRYWNINALQDMQMNLVRRLMQEIDSAPV